MNKPDWLDLIDTAAILGLIVFILYTLDHAHAI